jgi:hypothetical protein
VYWLEIAILAICGTRLCAPSEVVFEKSILPLAQILEFEIGGEKIRSKQFSSFIDIHKYNLPFYFHWLLK